MIHKVDCKLSSCKEKKPRAEPYKTLVENGSWKEKRDGMFMSVQSMEKIMQRIYAQDKTVEFFEAFPSFSCT